MRPASLSLLLVAGDLCRERLQGQTRLVKIVALAITRLTRELDLLLRARDVRAHRVVAALDLRDDLSLLTMELALRLDGRLRRAQIRERGLHGELAFTYGRIVHLASIAGKEGNPGLSPYNTSKAGMIGFVKGVAKEIAPHGVVINALAPAVISTPMNSNTSEETLKYMISRIPMGRVGQPEEVAEIVAFMASKACSFTTGFTFDASGGRATY